MEQESPMKETAPEVQQALLTRPELVAMLTELGRLAENAEVTVRHESGKPAEPVEGGVEALVRLLLDETAAAAQVRYRFDDELSMDTFQAAPDRQGFLLVRVRHADL